MLRDSTAKSAKLDEQALAAAEKILLDNSRRVW
jgi:hypothetical protein